MIILFFRNVFFILGFITIFSFSSFSATKFSENEELKLELVRIVLEKGIAKSLLFRDFVCANNLNDISFKYTFFSYCLLERNYNEQKGFTDSFIRDAIEGFPVERDSFQLLAIFYRDYHAEMQRFVSGELMFPKITEFVSNDSEMDMLLKKADLESKDPEQNRGLYLISVYYKDAMLEALNQRDHLPIEDVPYLPCPDLLLNSLLENPIRPGRKEMIEFYGNKQELINLIFESGIIRSDLLRKFILGNDSDNIVFYFNFQSPEDLSYLLNGNEVSVDLASHIIDEPEMYTSFLLDKIENFYEGNVDKVGQSIKHHQSESRSIEIHILGLMEMFPNREDVREVFNGHSNDDHANEKGFYVIFVSFRVEFNRHQILEDKEKLRINAYFPNSLRPRMFDFMGSKDKLIKKISSEGITKSKIFLDFINFNEKKDIVFKYCFISEKFLGNIFPSDEKYSNSVNRLVSGDASNIEIIFLRKEFYYDYGYDIEKFFASESREHCNSKCRIFHPAILELLKKDASTTNLLMSHASDLESERGVYLISAFFVPTDKKSNLPKRRGDKDRRLVSEENKERFMDKLFPRKSHEDRSLFK
jgi:hypothetical protein